jgi:hypothetical protein
MHSAEWDGIDEIQDAVLEELAISLMRHTQQRSTS